MIELLGVGVPFQDRWLLHRVCAHIDSGAVVAVCSGDPAERTALLDAVAGRTIAAEGRVWVSGVPVAKGSVGRVRDLVGEVEPGAGLDPQRSVLWHVLASRPKVGGLEKLWRFPRPRDRRAALRSLARVGLDGRAGELVGVLEPLARARLAVARALWRGPEYLLVREPDAALGGGTPELLALLRELVRAERLGVLVSGEPSESLLAGADRLLLLSEGLLVFDGAPGDVARPAGPGRRPGPIRVQRPPERRGAPASGAPEPSRD